MAGFLDAILGMSGQERTEALRQLGRDLEYYVPPELRGILGFLAEMTPTATLNRAAVAGGEMLAPDRTAMERLGSAGKMLSETAGVAAPMMVAGRAAMPAAQAIQEGLLGFSVAADDVGRRVVDRLNQPGPVPTMYSNPVGRAADDFTVTRKDASNIFGEGSERVRYTDAKSGGTMEVVVRPDGSASVLELEVPEASRGQGIGQALQQRVMQDFPVMGGQVSSKAAAKTAYRLGRRPYGQPDATLEDVFRMIDEDSSVNLISPQAQPNILPAPRNEAEAMAKQVLEMRAAGRAGDVTEEMMAAADPQYMFANTPLPMDYESRMARARELGFGKDRYHGSNMDFQGFAGNVFTSDNPTVASTYNRGTLDAQIYPVMTRQGPFGDVTVEGGLSNWNQLRPDMIDDPVIARELDRGMPISTRDIERQAVIEGRSGVTFKDINDLGPGFNSQQFKNLGYTPEEAEALRLQYIDELSAPSEVDVRLSPNLVRSRFARFDPEFSHLRNLSAGVGGLGILSLLAQQEQEREQEIRQYLGGLL